MAGDALLIDNRTEILRIAKANGATRVRIFGSFARGTARPDSDVDVLVDLEPGRHLFDLIAIKHGIEDLLGREVHIVPRRQSAHTYGTTSFVPRPRCEPGSDVSRAHS